MGNTGVPRPISREEQSGMDVPYQERATLQSILFLALQHCNEVLFSWKKSNVWAAATKVCMSPDCHGAPAKEKRETR